LPPSLPVLPYSFRQTTTVETLDTAHKAGQRETKVEEVFPVEGKLLFHRLISRNGKPLSPKEAETETKRLEAFRQAVRDGKKPKQSEQVTDLTARFSGEELDGRAARSKSVGSIRNSSTWPWTASSGGSGLTRKTASPRAARYG